MGRVGATKQEGGHVKLYSYKQGGGGGISFNHAEVLGGGGTERFFR